jgi:hypothetical protein
MAAVLMDTLDRIRVKDLTGKEYGYKDLQQEKNREFIRGMAWALCLVKSYELAFAETGDAEFDARLIDYRDQYQQGAAMKLLSDCGAMLMSMIGEEQGGNNT